MVLLQDGTIYVLREKDLKIFWMKFEDEEQLRSILEKIKLDLISFRSNYTFEKAKL